MGRALRDDARRPALHRTAFALSATPVRSWVWRQRDDARFSGRAVSMADGSGATLLRPRIVRVRSIQRTVRTVFQRWGPPDVQELDEDRARVDRPGDRRVIRGDPGTVWVHGRHGDAPAPGPEA